MSPPYNSFIRTAAIIIGRNEGERLSRCLASVIPVVDLAIYVDSGSTDGSVAKAIAAGAKVVQLDMSAPFTAARARNAGLELLEATTPASYVQFIDGDCELQPEWLGRATAFLDSRPRSAIACGRRRERFPEASIYNRLCDREWNTHIGQTKSCGGDALARMTALKEVGGYDGRLIAGEEPEMCLRLRKIGWEIWRLDEEMTRHDAAMTRFSQWWKRMKRGGYAAAEGMAMNGYGPERTGVATVARALGWGLLLPTVLVATLPYAGSFALLLLLLYPLQICRLAIRNGARADGWVEALFNTIGKFAEMTGVFSYISLKLRRRAGAIIEYK